MTSVQLNRSEAWAVQLFAGVPAVRADDALVDLPHIELDAGDELDIAANGSACAVVCTGRLALEFDLDETHRRIISLVEEGDVLVPPASFWTAVRPTLCCRAIERAVVTLVSEERFGAWLAEPRLAANLVRVLAAQVADRELAVAIALEPTVERRLALKLRQLADRWGKVTPRGVRLDLRLTHQQLADMVGAARESVTLALGRLGREGDIEVQNRTIWIRSAN